MWSLNPLILNCLVLYTKAVCKILSHQTGWRRATECANVLKTTRNSVTLYLDSNKIFNNKLIFSSIELSKEQLSKFLIPSTIWEVITGELLGVAGGSDIYHTILLINLK